MGRTMLAASLTLLLNLEVSAAEADEQGRMVQQMQIQAPSMTEEDQYGYNMPDRYRCDSCKAVVFHVNLALQSRQPRSRRLQEWEYTELFDETCTMDTFKGYGVGLVNGENALSGPGIPKKEELAPGMGAIQMSSDTWSKRLAESCRKLIYDSVGEEDIYNHFRKNGDKILPEICWETKECWAGQDAPRPKEETKEPKKDSKKKQVKKDAPKKEKQEAKTSKPTTEPRKEPKPKPSSEQETCTSAGPQDINTFLTKMAKKHGFPSADYTRERTTQDWEQLMLRMAGRIYENTAAKMN